MKVSQALHNLIHPASEAVSHLIDRVGWASVATTVGIKAGQQTELIESAGSWAMADYALMVSMVGGLTFILKNLVEVYFKIRDRKKK